MSTLAFIAAFRAMHDRAKSKPLTPAERAEYAEARRQFARVITVAQQLGHAGQTLRAGLRMAKMLKVEVKPEGGDALRVSTVDLSSGGFAALTQSGLRVGTPITFTLHLPKVPGGGTSPISGSGRVASSRAQTTIFRVSFVFDTLEPSAQEQLDIALVDAVLERFK